MIKLFKFSKKKSYYHTVVKKRLKTDPVFAADYYQKMNERAALIRQRKQDERAASVDVLRKNIQEEALKANEQQKDLILAPKNKAPFYQNHYENAIVSDKEKTKVNPGLAKPIPPEFMEYKVKSQYTAQETKDYNKYHYYLRRWRKATGIYNPVLRSHRKDISKNPLKKPDFLGKKRQANYTRDEWRAYWRYREALRGKKSWFAKLKKKIFG